MPRYFFQLKIFPKHVNASNLITKIDTDIIDKKF